MKNVFLKITKNEQLSKDIYLMRLEGDLSDIKNPGEFVEVKLKDYYLRRPISVHDFSENHLDLLYKVLGHGTKDMTNLKVNEELEYKITNGVKLDNAFDIKDKVIFVNKDDKLLGIYENDNDKLKDWKNF